MEDCKDVYRVAVVGDEGVGKTSIVCTISQPVALDHVPSVLPPIALPQLDARDGLPGVCVAVDTPAPTTEEARQTVISAVRTAHCVIIVVDALRPATLARVFDFWEPFIASARGPAELLHAADVAGISTTRELRVVMEKKQQSSRVPVVIALNKSDLTSLENPQGIQMCAVLARAVESCRVESAFTCCARARQNVVDMFQSVRKLIFFPITALLTTTHRDADFGSSVSVDGRGLKDEEDDYENNSEQLTEGCKMALARVFHLIDKDNDDILNEQELDSLAQLMFSGSDDRRQRMLQTPSKGNADDEDPLNELKQMIMDMHIEAGDVSLVPGDQTTIDESTIDQEDEDADLSSFTPIHTPLHGSRPGAIAPGPRPTPHRQPATTPMGVTYVDVPEFSLFELENLVLRYATELPEVFWKVLYHFGYDTSLKLTTALLSPEVPSVAPGNRLELSDKAIAFISERFQAHDKTKKGSLNEEDLTLLFSTVPDGQPFPGEAPMNLKEFIEHWHMLCLVDPKVMLRTLGCLGYEDDLNEAVVEHKGVIPSFHPLYSSSFDAELKELAAEPLPPRTVFHGFVFGSRGSGKTSILRGLAGKPFDAEEIHFSKEQWACGTVWRVPELKDIPAHLVLTEFLNDDDDIVEDCEQMKRCDVCCFVFDTHNPNSFAHVLRLHELVMERYPWIPCIHIATKTDLTSVRQVAHISPHAFLSAHSLPQPVALSMLNDTSAVASAGANTVSTAFSAMATPYIHGTASQLYVEMVHAACSPSNYVDKHLVQAQSMVSQQQQQQDTKTTNPPGKEGDDRSTVTTITVGSLPQTVSWRRVAFRWGLIASVGVLAAFVLHSVTSHSSSTASFRGNNNQHGSSWLSSNRSNRSQPASHYIFAWLHPWSQRK